MSDFLYRVVDVKADVHTGRWLLMDVLRAQSGWELVSVVPMIRPQSPGDFSQTGAQAVFKRPAR